MSEDRAVDSEAPAAGQYEPLMNVLMRESHGNFKRFFYEYLRICSLCFARVSLWITKERHRLSLKTRLKFGITLRLLVQLQALAFDFHVANSIIT